MTKHNAIISHPAIQLFIDQAVTLSSIGSRVSVQCDSFADAESVFDLLESLYGLRPMGSPASGKANEPDKQHTPERGAS